MRRLLAFGAGLLLVPFLIAGCSDSDDDDNTPPAATSAATGSSGATGSTGAPSVDLSTDDLDRSVDLPESHERVVALSPSIVELMYAVGATPVGRPESADYPPEASSVASFGSSYQPSFEEIAAMQPDLIIADAIIHAGIIAELEALNIPVFAIRVDSFETVTDALREVGALTGNAEAGEDQAKALEDKLAEVESKIPAEGPSVLIVVAAGQNQFIAGKSNSYLGSLITELGATNAVGDEPENFRFPGFADYSLEKIVTSNPDIIIGMSVGGPPGTPKTTEILGQTPAWNSLKAVQEDRVVEVDEVIYLQSAGPRLSEILDELPGILYPDVFASR